MNRRNLLKQSALLTLAASLSPSLVFANSSTQNNESSSSGYFKFSLEDLRLLIITDGHILISPAQPIIAPEIDKNKVTAAMKEQFISADAVDAAINVLVIFKGDKTILIDTGSGTALGKNSGWFLRNLTAAGVHPDMVTDVLITHLHVDHIGGILDKDGNRIFKNANYYLSQIEHDFWLSENPDFSKSKNTSSSKESVVLACKVVEAIKDKLNLFDFGTTLFDCIKTESAEGHTPGHPLLTIFSKNQELKHIVDTVHTSLLVTHPEWGTQWDIDFGKGVATRKRVLKEVSESKILLLSCHLPWPGFGHVVKNRKGYNWVPMPFSTPQLFEKDE